MNREQFWALLKDLDPQEAVDQLGRRLARLEVDEIVAFQVYFDEEFDRAYRWDLWGAAYVIEGGCSDDGFIDFRYGLLARGQQVFEAALACPDSLADVLNPGESICNEEFGYVAARVYEGITGDYIPRGEGKRSSEPSGENWDFDDEVLCAKHLPRLWALSATR